MNVPFRSIVVGAACAIALVVLAFALAPFFDAVGVYIAPFALLAPVIDKVVPEALISVIDRFMPIAGPAAGVALIVSSVLAFWTIIFSALHLAWVRLRRKQS